MAVNRSSEWWLGHLEHGFNCARVMKRESESVGKRESLRGGRKEGGNLESMLEKLRSLGATLFSHSPELSSVTPRLARSHGFSDGAGDAQAKQTGKENQSPKSKFGGHTCCAQYCTVPLLSPSVFVHTCELLHYHLK
jgi:hypothetical protein